WRARAGATSERNSSVYTRDPPLERDSAGSGHPGHSMREVKGPLRRGDSPRLAPEALAGYLRSVSKAFTKDEAWEEPIVPPRAPLPAGVPNYRTPPGLRLLRAQPADPQAE